MPALTESCALQPASTQPDHHHQKAEGEQLPSLQPQLFHCHQKVTGPSTATPPLSWRGRPLPDKQ